MATWEIKTFENEELSALEIDVNLFLTTLPINRVERAEVTISSAKYYRMGRIYVATILFRT